MMLQIERHAYHLGVDLASPVSIQIKCKGFFDVSDSFCTVIYIS